MGVIPVERSREERREVNLYWWWVVAESRRGPPEETPRHFLLPAFSPTSPSDMSHSFSSTTSSAGASALSTTEPAMLELGPLLSPRSRLYVSMIIRQRSYIIGDNRRRTPRTWKGRYSSSDIQWVFTLYVCVMNPSPGTSAQHSRQQRCSKMSWVWGRRW